VVDDLVTLLPGRERGQAFGPFGTDGINGEVERHSDPPVRQEAHGAELLFPGSTRRLLMGSRVRQKRLDGCTSPLVRVSCVEQQQAVLEILPAERFVDEAPSAGDSSRPLNDACRPSQLYDLQSGRRGKIS
jgi:hypothetical protein